MAAWRRAIALSLGDAELERLRSIAQSQTGPASRVERARIVLGYWQKPSSCGEVKPHKMRYYLERGDPQFAEKMAEVLGVYRKVKVMKAAATAKDKPDDAVAIISYDEKPGVQTLCNHGPRPAG
jgi:hypothetical protein